MIHDGAVWAVSALPLGVFAFLILVQQRALRGGRSARSFLLAYNEADGALKTGAFLLAMSAAIHLGLAPNHAAADAPRAALFILNGLGGLVLAVLVFGASWARWVAIGWLSFSILAYSAYVLAGREVIDAVGVLTLIIEIVAVGLLGGLAQITRRSAAIGSPMDPT